MWMLKEKSTGKIVEPRSGDFPLSPSDFGAESWEEVFAADRETDLVDGWELFQLETLERTTIRDYTDVIVTAGMIDSSGEQIFGLYGSESDAKADDALGSVGRNALAPEQIAMAERNSDRLASQEPAA